MDSIFKRRSIRKFTSEKVNYDDVEKILKAGMAAPSAGNEQAWQFIVIDNKEILNEIPKIHPYSSMLKETSCAIVVCGDLSLEKFKGFWIQDCSAATQNMLLMADSIGLGSVWLGVYPELDRIKGIKEILNLPENIIPLAILPIGYPDEKKSKTDRFDKSRIHKNKW